MAIPDAASAAEKWVSRMSSSTEEYRKGIQRVQENPMAKAAQNVDAYRQGIMDAINDGRYVAGLQRVTLQQWKDAASKTGAERLASGATAGKPKMMAFLQSFLPFLANAQAQVKAMPNATFEQRKARMNAMADLVHQFKR